MITLNDVERNGRELNSCSDELLELINVNISFIKFQRLDCLKSTIKQLNRMLSYYIKMEIADDNIDFARGRLAGITEFYNSVIKLYERVENVSRSVDDVFAFIKTVCHGEEVLENLSCSRGIMHRELARLIDVSTGTLTGIMDKLEDMQLVRYSKVGKFKFYYLSELGQNYKDEKNFQPKYYIEELATQLAKEKERTRYLEKELHKEKLASKKIGYVMDSRWDAAKINRLADCNNEIEKAQKVLKSWEKERAFKLTNKCGAFN